MPKRDILLYINDIILSCSKIAKYTKELSFPEFKKDSKTKEAIERNLEIIGEATVNIPAKLRSQYKDIHWRQMKSMRNKVIHEYFGINDKILWETAINDIPALKKRITKIKTDLKEHALFDG